MDVCGLEISANNLRAVKLSAKGNILSVQKFGEVELPAGVISDGKIINQADFEKALINLIRNNRFGGSRWIVTIPGRRVYTAYKMFPELPYEDLASAVQMNINTILPGDLNNISWGWQEVSVLGKASGKEVMVASISKNDLGEYLTSLAKAGIAPIAVETKAISAARVLGQQGNTLVLNLEGLILTSVIINGGFARFTREFELARDEKEQFKSMLTEVRKVINYFLTEQKNAKIEKIILDGSSATAKIAESLTKNLGQDVQLAKDLFKVQKIAVPSLALYGVGLRALTDQSQDASLSLLPVGSRQAYEEKRTLNFWGGISNIVVITSILIILVFLGSYIFLNYLNSSKNAQISSMGGNINENTTDPALVAEVQNVNKEMAIEAALEDKMTNWGPVLTGIFSVVPTGVTLKEVSEPKEADPVTITGIAQSREALATFNDAISAQPFTESVQLPRSDFGENKIVNFTMSLTLKQDALIQ